MTPTQAESERQASNDQNGWGRKKLKSVAKINPDSINNTDFDFEEIAYLDISSTGKGQIETLQSHMIDEAPSRAKRVVDDGDSVISRVRPSREQYTFLQNPPGNMVVSTGFAVLRPKEGQVVDDRFLYYATTTPEFINWMDAHKSGSAYPAVNISEIKEAKIPVPPLEEQKKIAEILGNIDDKIQVNTRINNLLEEAVQTLFNNWFVDFGPYEEYKDSELGNIPNDFEVVEIRELCDEIQNGGTPKRSQSEYWGGDIPWIKTGELNDQPIVETDESITEKGLKDNNCHIAEENTVLVALYGASVGNLGLTKLPATFNQACCSLKAKSNIGYAYLYQCLRDLKPKLKQLSRGSAQQNISQGIIKEQKVVLPPEKDLREFQEYSHYMYEEIRENMQQNIALEALRDTLLPKLMSGEIRVNDINLEDLEVSSEV